MTTITRAPDCAINPENASSVAIALALMGAAKMPEAALSDAVTWERTDAPSTVGADSILSNLPGDPETVHIDQVATQGQAGSVTGRVTRDGQTAIFCHVLRFDSPSRQTAVQLVSIERAVPA